MAVGARVSRATAYRYFPTRSALVTAVVHTSLASVRSFSSRKADGRERLHDLFNETFPRFSEFEPQLRAAAQLALEQWALERAGLLEEVPYRSGHRVRILEDTLAPPLAKAVPPAVLQRLLHALSSAPRCGWPTRCSMRRCATRPLWLRRARRLRADADRRSERCRRLRVTHRLGTRQRA